MTRFTVSRRFHQVASVLAVTLAFTLNLLGDEEGPPKKKYPPIPVNAEVFQSHDQWIVEVAKKIQDGTATTQERRAWYELKKRYFPFTPDAIPPKNWRVDAVRQGDLLDPQLNPALQSKTAGPTVNAARAGVRPQAATDYTWTGLGQNVPWCQGQPPAAGCPDQGSGRATAVWVNPNNKAEVLLGFADGGVWKSTNISATRNTATFTPLTDFQPTSAIGSIEAQVSPLDGNLLGPNTKIWAATGEGNFSAGDVQGVGVLKSTNGGASWQLKQVPWVVAGDGTTMFDRTSIRRILLDPRNSNNLWIAADSGVFRSIDAGDTWALVTTLPYYKKYAGDCWYVYYTDLVIDNLTPAVGQPSHVYVAHGRTGNAGCSTVSRQDNGLFRSTDDGGTWASITVPNANCPGVVAGTTSRGYTCVGGAGSPPSGLTNSTTVNGTVGRISLVQQGNDKKHLYLLVQDTTTNSNQIIRETVDGSIAAPVWTARAATVFTGQQAWYDMVGATDPAAPARLFVGGLNGYISGNNGATISTTASWTGWGGNNYAHADHHQAVWVKAATPPVTASDMIYLATDGGLSVGTVTGTGLNGVTWVTNTRAMASQAYGIGQSAQVGNRVHMGNQDNGEPKVVLDASNNIIQWWEIRGGDGGFSMTNRTNDAIAYNEYVYGGMYRATNANYTTTAAWNWTCFAPLGTAPACATNTCNGNCVIDNATQFIAPMMLDRNNQNLLYFGSRFVYRRDTVGATWLAYSPDLTTTNNGNSILWVHSAFNNGVAGTIWATTENGMVWRSTNATCTTANCPTWTNLTKAPLPVRAASWVETHPTNANQAFITFLGFNTGHVFRTLDGGTTFTDVSGLLPNEPFNSIAIEPTAPFRVFANSDTGMFVNEDPWNPAGGSTWIRINNGTLPYGKVYSMEFSPAPAAQGGGKLRAPTHGRGLWELTIAPGAGCGGSIPAAPTGLVATAGSNITLTWNAVAGATSYKVYRVTGSGCPMASGGVVIASGITGTSYVDPGACGNVYSYQVTGVNASSCEGDRSNCASATLPVPAAPTVTATPGNAQVSLSWSAVSGASSYEVWRISAATCPNAGPGTMIASGITGTSYINTGLTNGTSYVYFVRGTGSCIGPYSSCVAATPTACTPPGAPTASASATGANQVTVTWTPGVPAPTTGWNVYRISGSSCPAGTTGMTLLTGVPLPLATLSYIDNGASGVNTYTYKVEAVTASCTNTLSGCSTVIAWGDCVTPPTFAGLSTATVSASTICTIDLAWAAGASTCGNGVTYSIHRSTTSGFTPALANRIDTSVTGTAYADSSALLPSTAYYYVVRASDTRSGAQEANTVQRTATTGAGCTSAPRQVQVFTARSTGDATTGTNMLEWLNPAIANAGTTVTINFRTDIYPTSATDAGATTILTNRAVVAGAADTYTHTPVTNGTTYYYAIWVRY